MKRLFAAIIVVLLVVPLDCRFAWAAQKPTVEARGAILIDFETGRVLWEKNAGEPMPMASTTKIMTAVLTLENGNLDDIVTVSARAEGTPKVKMYLSAGERIPLRVLLYALMLQSSNDAAVAIAEHIGGSVEEFCWMMTEKARELGATETVFETPNGLDQGDHHSTAYDMALIARYALNNPDFLRIINTREYNGESDRRSYHIVNKNRFLSEFQGANGVKTGFTGKAGHCFVGSAERDGMRLISVVLASGWGVRGREQKWIDTKRVMNYGFDNYSVETVITDGAPAGDVAVERSKTAAIPAAYGKTFRLPLNDEEKDALRLEATVPDSVRAPIAAGDKLGICEIFIGGEKLAEVDIIAVAAADRHDLKTCMEKALAALLETVTRREVDVVLPEF